MIMEMGLWLILREIQLSGIELGNVGVNHYVLIIHKCAIIRHTRQYVVAMTQIKFVWIERDPKWLKSRLNACARRPNPINNATCRLLTCLLALLHSQALIELASLDDIQPVSKTHPLQAAMDENERWPSLSFHHTLTNVGHGYRSQPLVQSNITLVLHNATKSQSSVLRACVASDW